MPMCAPLCKTRLGINVTPENAEVAEGGNNFDRRETRQWFCRCCANPIAHRQQACHIARGWRPDFEHGKNRERAIHARDDQYAFGDLPRGHRARSRNAHDK